MASRASSQATICFVVRCLVRRRAAARWSGFRICAFPQDSNAVTGRPRALGRRFNIEGDAFLQMLGLAGTESAAAIPCRHPCLGSCWQALRF
jgi:hypothetical protein